MQHMENDRVQEWKNDETQHSNISTAGVRAVYVGSKRIIGVPFQDERE